ncbi:Alpha/Beta hydrolase protein [Terfezia claveryi]|nr:Alpha/Beta hydrolase protein [Terfezia claveryi]
MADIEVQDEAAPLTLKTPGLFVHGTLSYPKSISKEMPIVVMIHGFPESSEMWKYVLDRFPPNIPVYVPDIPGYGRSTLKVTKDAYSKREVGNVILDALKQMLGNYPGILSEGIRQKIVLVGHDRGARISHRLAVDNCHPHFEIIGAALLDIVPTLVQFRAFANPSQATIYYHWSFLAAPKPIPEDTIDAIGGGNWIESGFGSWRCTWEEAQKRMEANVPIYQKYFNNRATIEAVCADYRGGATVDFTEQVKDQEEGRKLKVPTLVIYAEDFIGSRFDFWDIWKEWVEDEKLLQLRSIGNGVVHFLPEEDPDTVTELILGWLRDVLKIRVPECACLKSL